MFSPSSTSKIGTPKSLAAAIDIKLKIYNTKHLETGTGMTELSVLAAKGCPQFTVPIQILMLVSCV